MKFESIRTIDELMNFIQAHGIPTDTESICKMQDIAGHSTIEELTEIANGDHHHRFYNMLFKVWNYEDAIRFYNQNSNPAYIEAGKAAAELKKTREKMREDAETIDGLMLRIGTLEEQEKKARVDISNIDEKAAALEFENMVLKAKLYDLMVKEDPK